MKLQFCDSLRDCIMGIGNGVFSVSTLVDLFFLFFNYKRIVNFFTHLCYFMVSFPIYLVVKNIKYNFYMKKKINLWKIIPIFYMGFMFLLYISDVYKKFANIKKARKHLF